MIKAQIDITIFLKGLLSPVWIPFKNENYFIIQLIFVTIHVIHRTYYIFWYYS